MRRNQKQVITGRVTRGTKIEWCRRAKSDAAANDPERLKKASHDLVKMAVRAMVVSTDPSGARNG